MFFEHVIDSIIETSISCYFKFGPTVKKKREAFKNKQKLLFLSVLLFN